MFDLKTFKVLGRIPAAEDADAIIYDSASNRVFTLNGDAHSSTVIDSRAGTLITNIPLGGKPEYGASAGDGKVYANLTDTSEVVEIDAKTATVARRWSTAPCKQPVAMAIDTAHHRLFSGCRSGVMAVSDYQAGKMVATVPIGKGTDGAGFDAASGNAFASNADGTLTVIHQDARPDPRGRRRRRDHLRQPIEPRLHVQWRRPLVDGNRAARRDPDQEHSARWQTGIRCVRWRRQGVRESHRHQRSGRDRRKGCDGDPALADSPVQAASRHGHRYRPSSAV